MIARIMVVGGMFLLAFIALVEGDCLLSIISTGAAVLVAFVVRTPRKQFKSEAAMLPVEVRLKDSELESGRKIDAPNTSPVPNYPCEWGSTKDNDPLEQL
jgi:hypothetical protein